MSGEGEGRPAGGAAGPGARSDPGASGPGRTRRERWRRRLLGVIGLLYVVSVPWYRTADSELVLWLGLPDWVAVALVCYVAIAVLNSIAWSLGEIRDAPLAGAPAARGERPERAGGHPAEERPA